MAGRVKRVRYAARMLVLLVLSGCTVATEAKYRARLDPWMGERIDVLVEEWGYPSYSFNAPSGRPVYAYVYQTSYMTPIYTTGSSRTVRSVFGGFETSTQSQTFGGQTVTYSCRTYFEVAGAKRQIVKISFEGDSCKSY